MRKRFTGFLDTLSSRDPLKAEYYLPSVPDALIHEGTGTVKVMSTDERWYGVTYRDDLQRVKTALDGMRAAGDYTNML